MISQMKQEERDGICNLLYILIRYRLNVETDRWNRRDTLIQFEFVQDSCIQKWI